MSNLGSGEYLNIFGVMIVDVDGDRVELSDIEECEIHLERPHTFVFPADPLVTWKWRRRGLIINNSNFSFKLSTV